MAKKTVMYPFAPNGLLSDKQTNQLKQWIEGENRNVTKVEISKEIGVSRNKVYQSFDNNPERPFDELSLKAVNRLIALYNRDIKNKKESKKEAKQRETKEEKKKVKALINKVEDGM